MISGFRRAIKDIFALLGCSAASIMLRISQKSEDPNGNSLLA